MRLVDLADEILLDIIRLTLEGDEYGAEDVQQFALTCKRIKRVCDAVLWSKYTLVIRLPSTRYLNAPRVGTFMSSKEWRNAFHARIVHLLSKACVVRHLTVVDSVASHWGCDTAVGVPRCSLFAPEVMDAVVPAIAACSSLTTLHLRSGLLDMSAHWPDKVWSLIQRGLPCFNSLELGASFTDIPALRGPSMSLGALELRWCSGLVDGLLKQDVLTVSHLKITFADAEVAPARQGGRCLPLGQLARHLRTLQVDIPHSHLPNRRGDALFDVSNIPQAQIFVKVTFNCEEREIPSAWWDAKHRIDNLILGGVRRCEVVNGNGCVYVFRPPLVDNQVYRPNHQDHKDTCAVADDPAARKAMENHYRQFQALFH